MTSETAVEYPKPRDWQQFERLSRSLFSEIYERPFKRWGRGGQRQNGVDLVAQLRDGRVIAVQCKGRSTNLGSKLKPKDVDAAVADTDTYPHPLELLVIATTAPDDKTLDAHALTLSQQREAAGKFSVQVWGWETICDHIGEHEKVQRRYYGRWFQRFSVWQWLTCAAGASLLGVLAFLGTTSVLDMRQIAVQRSGESIRQLQTFVRHADELIGAYANCEKQLSALEFAFSGQLKRWCIEPIAANVGNIEQQIQQVAPQMDADAWAEINTLAEFMREDQRQGLIAVEMTTFFEDRMVRSVQRLCSKGAEKPASDNSEADERESNRSATVSQLHFYFVVRDFVLPALRSMKARSLVHARRLANEALPKDLLAEANRLPVLLEERRAYVFEPPQYPLTLSALKARSGRNITVSGDNNFIENQRWLQIRLAAVTKSFFGRPKEVEQLISCGVFKPEARVLVDRL